MQKYRSLLHRLFGNTTFRKLRGKVTSENPALSEVLAEFYGMLVYTLIGSSLLAQFVITNGKYRRLSSVYWGLGLGKTVGMYLTGRNARSHLNPAISLAYGVCKQLSPRRVLLYILAQTLGAFAASSLVHLVFREGLYKRDNNANATMSETRQVFCAYSKEIYLGIRHDYGWLHEMCGAAVMSAVTFAVTDSRHEPAVPDHLQPLILGLLGFILSASFRNQYGTTLNPAKDLAGRLYMDMVGWTSVYHRSFYLLPLCGPFMGAIWGALLYKGAVHIHIKTGLGLPTQGWFPWPSLGDSTKEPPTTTTGEVSEVVKLQLNKIVVLKST